VRVAVYHNNRDVRLEETPVPEIGAGEVLLRIEASGICGSDVMEWYRLARAPLVLGHEVSGTIVEVGAGTEAFRAGQRVVTTHHVPCEACRYCLAGHQNVCDTLRTTHFDPGGFAEYVRLPRANVERGTFLLPDTVSFEQASFVEPLACVVRAQRIAGVSEGRSVAVLGSGISGILHIELARASGAAPIVATDVSDYRLDAARRFGATAAFRAEEDVPDRIRDANEGRLADVVLVCTAALPAIAQAFRCVERGGTILFFAPVAPGLTFPVPMHDTWRDGITIAHSYAGPPQDMREALDLIARGRVDVASMITHRLGLAETGEGFRLVADAGESLKVIVEPQR
jgi:L-iditol 2-dehydrogenase